MKKNFKVLPVMLAVLMLVLSLPVTSFAATDGGTITGDSSVDDVTLKVIVPTSLDFALDPLELNVTSGSQVATTSYIFVNKTAAPVKITVGLTAEPAEDVTLVDDPDTLSPYDTEVTDKKIFFAALGATGIAEDAIDFAFDDESEAPEISYSDDTSPKIPFKSSTKKANIAFALDKAADVETDGTPGDDAALADDAKGVAAFQFFSKLNTYAEWEDNDIDVSGAYKLIALSATTYGNYEEGDYEQGGVNQLVVKIPVSEITVTAADDADSVVNGEKLQMTAVVTPDDATNDSVTWSVEAGTGTATISETGELTATGVGTVTVVATAKDGSGVSGELEITVTAAPVAVTAIEVTAENDAESVAIGYTLQMTAVVTPEDATDKSVTWSVDDEDVATIDEEGLLTALSEGTVTVKATANDESEVVGELEITVTEPVIGFTDAGGTATSSVTKTITVGNAPEGGFTFGFYYGSETIASFKTAGGTTLVEGVDYTKTENSFTITQSRLQTIASTGLKTYPIVLSDGKTYTINIQAN